MEPQIRYARREDGARTAYAVMGHGPVLVCPPGFFSHLEWALQDNEESKRFWATLAEYRTVILYDRHGCGLSDRRRTDFTAEDDMRDIYAVVEASGASEIDLLAISFGGLPATRFAAEHPHRVRRLMLWGTTGLIDRSRFPEDLQAQARALDALRRSDFNAFMRAMAGQMFPSGVAPEVFRSFVSLNLAAATVEMQEQLEHVVFDNLALLPLVSSPTLVMHRRGDQMVPFAAGQLLARRLPNARFAPMDGDEHQPYSGDADTVLHTIIEFLGEDAPTAPTHTAPAANGTDGTPATIGSGTAVILFTDIVESSALTERMGDAAFRAAARTLDERIRTAIRDAGGTSIEAKTLGDGVLAIFTSAAAAIGAARRCIELSGESELRLHVGLHAGDVIREDDNVYGGAVNIAARICGLSAPGEILVSGTIRDLARTSAAAKFEDRGDHALKGIEGPIHLFSVA